VDAVHDEAACAPRSTGCCPPSASTMRVASARRTVISCARDPRRRPLEDCGARGHAGPRRDLRGASARRLGRASTGRREPVRDPRSAEAGRRHDGGRRRRRDESGTAGGAPIECEVRAWDAWPADVAPPDEALVQAATVAGTAMVVSGAPVWLATPIVSYMTGCWRHWASRPRTWDVSAALRATRACERLRRPSRSTAEPTSRAGAQERACCRGDPRASIRATASTRPPTAGSSWRAHAGFWVKLMTFLERIDLWSTSACKGTAHFGAPEVRAFVRAELAPVFARRTTAAWVACSARPTSRAAPSSRATSPA